MPDVIVRTQVRPSSTGSTGTTNGNGKSAYSPAIAETNAVTQRDPFFRVSPAIAVGDGYLTEMSESPGALAPRN